MPRCNLQRVPLASSSRTMHNRSTLPPLGEVWYKRQPIGVNKNNQMMKSIIKDTSLEESSGTFSNYSARKLNSCYFYKKLTTAGVEGSSILKVTGHRTYSLWMIMTKRTRMNFKTAISHNQQRFQCQPALVDKHRQPEQVQPVQFLCC